MGINTINTIRGLITTDIVPDAMGAIGFVAPDMTYAVIGRESLPEQWQKVWDEVERGGDFIVIGALMSTDIIDTDDVEGQAGDGDPADYEGLSSV